MKKLISVLVAALFLIGLMVPAMAEVSPGALDTEAVSVEVDEGVQLPEGSTVTAAEADTESYPNEDVAEAVSEFKSSSVRDLVNSLEAYLPEGSSLSEDGNTLTQGDEVIDLSGYEFITAFTDMPVTDAEGNADYDVSRSVSAVVTFQVDALTGVSEEDMDAYKVLLVSPATGELVFLDMALNADGTVTAEFPFLGTFAVVQNME